MTQFGWVCVYRRVGLSSSSVSDCPTAVTCLRLFDPEHEHIAIYRNVGAAYSSTRRNDSEDSIHIRGCSRSRRYVVDGTTTFECIRHLSTRCNVSLLAQEMSKPRERSEWPFVNDF